MELISLLVAIFLGLWIVVSLAVAVDRRDRERRREEKGNMEENMLWNLERLVWWIEEKKPTKEKILEALDQFKEKYKTGD